MFAVAIALVMGALFYGLNNISVNQAGSGSAQPDGADSPRRTPPRLLACVT